MKIRTLSSISLFLAVLLAVCVAMFFIPACAKTERGKLGQNYTAIAASADTFSSLYDAGFISKDELKSAAAAVRAYKSSIDAWDNARLAGDTSTASKAEATALAALSEVQRLLTLYSVRKNE